MRIGQLLHLTATGPRSAALWASVAVHGAIAFAAAGHGPRSVSAPSRPAEVQIEVEAPVTPVEADEHHDVVAEHGHEHEHLTAAPHSHPYPVAPDHDLVPHSPLIDHRVHEAAGALAAAPSVVAAPAAPSRPTFSMVLGQAAATSGGSSSAAGVGAGAGAAGSDSIGPDPRSDELYADATVSQHARLVSPLRPEYPPAARAQGVEAALSLEIVVDRSGRVTDVRVLRGAGHGFEAAAIRALRSAEFAPARWNDRPVRVRMPWTVDFRLE